MKVERIIEKAIEAGGKRWTKGDMDRVYVNPQTLGYEFSYYNTGNLSNVKDPDGDHASNAEGRRVLASKAWVDCKDGSAHTKTSSTAFEGFFEDWFERIKTEAEKEEQAEAENAQHGNSVFALIDSAVIVTSEEMKVLEENYDGESLEHELRKATASGEYKTESRTEMRFTEKPIVNPVFTKTQKENGDWLIRLTGYIARVEIFDEYFDLESYTDFEL